MKTIKFTVFSAPSGFKNPVPYKRTTQRGKFVDKGYKRYSAWKSLVQGCFFLKYHDQEYIRNYAEKKKPLNPKGKFRMDLKIYYCDKTHGDSDNVYKGIADALFIDDKYIYGSFTFEYDKIARVEIEVEL